MNRPSILIATTLLAPLSLAAAGGESDIRVAEQRWALATIRADA